MSALAILEQELADTLEWARRKRRQPATVIPLTRDLVGKPSVQRHGRCCYCADPTPGRNVCEAHTDLPSLDVAYRPVVIRNNKQARPQILSRVRGRASQERL